MDEQISNVINFLFVPEATLSIIFLVVFLILLIFGVYIYILCRRHIKSIQSEAESEYELIFSRITPEAFLNKKIDKFSALEGVLEGIPDYFVSIGILATFIGLGVAIQEAADLLNAEKFEIDKLISLLGIIAFKFQTSVWGIGLSLLFRRFIVEWYFNYRQRVIDEIREILYAKERDSIQTLLEKQNAFLVKEFDYRREADNALLAKLQDMINEQENIGQRQIVNNNLLNEKSINALNVFQQCAETSWQSLQEKLSAVLKAQSDALQSILNQREALYNEQISIFGEFQKELSKNNAITQDILTSQLTTVAGIQKKLERYVSAGEKFVSTAKNFTVQTETFGNQVTDFRLEIVKMQENISQTLDEIGNKQYDMLDKMHKHVQEVQKIFLHDENMYVRQTQESFQRLMIKTEENFHKLMVETEASFKNILNDSINGVQESYTKEVKRFAGVTGNLSEVLVAIDQHVNKLHQEMISEQKKIEALQQSSLHEVTRVVEDIDTHVNKLHQEMISEQKEIEVLQKSAFNEVTRVVGGIDALVNKLHQEMILEHKKMETLQESSFNEVTRVVGDIGIVSKKYGENLFQTHNAIMTSLNGMEKLQEKLTLSLGETERIHENTLNKNEQILKEFIESVASSLNSLKQSQSLLHVDMEMAVKELNESLKEISQETRRQADAKENELLKQQRVEQCIEEFKAEIFRILLEGQDKAMRQRSTLDQNISTALKELSDNLSLKQIITTLSNMLIVQERMIDELKMLTQQKELSSFPTQSVISSTVLPLDVENSQLTSKKIKDSSVVKVEGQESDDKISSWSNVTSAINNVLNDTELNSTRLSIQDKKSKED